MDRFACGGCSLFKNDDVAASSPDPQSLLSKSAFSSLDPQYPLSIYNALSRSRLYNRHIKNIEG